jgi:hypothetical protein
VVVNNLGERPSLMKNFGATKRWLMVQCVGTTANRDAVGARVVVKVGAKRYTGEVLTGASFLSQNDTRLHFGMGDAGAYDAIEVSWPGGTREAFPGGPADRHIVLKQGTGKRLSER